jgi:nucleoside-diphosphate-sugar epimerase
MKTIKHIIVTGGTGYIGESVVKTALGIGIKVTLLCRSPRQHSHSFRCVSWQMGQPIPPECVDSGIPLESQALIHLAHDWRNSKGSASNEGGLNIDAAQVLLASCRKLRLGRIVFVSSQSAREDAANIYGRVKWSIEQAFNRPNEVSARVGLVYGGPRRAMFGLLCRLTELAPILPMIDPWRKVQPIHRDEVSSGLLLIADSDIEGWVGLAAPEGIPFGDFLKTLAREYFGRTLHIIPIPLKLALMVADIAARIPFAPKIDRERILGLAGTLPMPCADHLARLGLAISPLAQGLRNAPQSKKTLLREGYIFLSYVLQSMPGRLLMRNYARSTMMHGEGPLPLLSVFQIAPSLLRLVEPFSRLNPLSRRLQRATLLAEASPEGERVLFRNKAFGTRLIFLALQIALDIFAMPIRLIIGILRR